MNGFIGASAWSPFFIGMVVVLVAIPSVTWPQIAIEGMGMAVVMILSGWLFDRLRYPSEDRVRHKYLTLENQQTSVF
jgi:hypothetical protein